MMEEMEMEIEMEMEMMEMDGELALGHQNRV